MDTETAAEVAELESQLTVLKQMRASGTFSVRHGDQMVQFRTLKEIMTAIKSVTKEIAKLKGETRPGVGYVRQSCKGL